MDIWIAQSIIVVFSSANISITSLDSQNSNCVATPWAVSHVVGVSFANDSDNTSATGLIPVSSFAPVHDINGIFGDSTDTVLAVRIGAVSIAIVSIKLAETAAVNKNNWNDETDDQ